MAAVFQKAISDLFAAEGGYNKKAENDYGGETKYGISKRQFPDVDIANLTPEKAAAILEIEYWNRYRCNEIQDQIVANQIFLLLINMNPLHAVEIVQKAVNVCGRTIINVRVDGVLGSKTLQAINSISAYWLSDRIRVEASRYYLAETDRDSAQIPNFRGWIRRALQ